MGVETSNVGVATDPDCLGPCEPGTSITLEGLVWHETENGQFCVEVNKLSIYSTVNIGYIFGIPVHLHGD